MNGSLPFVHLEKREAHRNSNFRDVGVLSKAILIFIAISLSVSPLTLAEETGSIRKGNVEHEKVIVEFGSGGGIDPSLSIPIPDGGPVIGATLMVSTVDGMEGPSSVSIDIGMDGRKEWSFGGGAQGDFGRQIAFITGSDVERELMSGSTRTITILLPENSEVSDASMDIYLPPTLRPEGARRIWDILPDDVRADSMDIGDIDGDGIEEITYHYLPDSAIYVIHFDGKGNYSRTRVLDGVSGDPSVRILDGDSKVAGGIVLQYFEGTSSGDKVSLLTGSGWEDLKEIELANNLSRMGNGFQVLKDEETLRDIVYVLKPNGGGLSEFSLGESGSLIEQVVLDSTPGIIGIGTTKILNGGVPDIILFPENEDSNITILTTTVDNNGSPSTGFLDLDSFAPISGQGTSIDLDGDGREEFYFPSGPYKDLAVISWNGTSPALSWVGLNNTFSSPRSIPREFYGDGGAYTGPEGFLYTSSKGGFYQILPGNNRGYLIELLEDIDGPALLGEFDATGSGNVFSFTSNDGLISSGTDWNSINDISMGSSSGSIDIAPNSSHFSLDLKTLLPNDIQGTLKSDIYGNTFKALDLYMVSSPGFITFKDLSIDYRISIDISDSPYFMKAMEKAQNDFDQSFVPFMVRAGSSGALEIGPVTVTYDSPPVILDSLPEKITIMEGSLGQTLIDILDHVDDDLLGTDKLSLEIIPISQIPGGLLFIDNNHLLVSHASQYPDLNGNFSFRIGVSDLNSRVLSKPINLVILPVQDNPQLLRGIGSITISEGEERRVELTGENGIFKDPDGDPMTFEVGIISTDPPELRDDLDIWIDEDELILYPSIMGSGGFARIEVIAFDPQTGQGDGTRTIGEIEVINMDADPWIGANPGLVNLVEDQEFPTRIPIEGWIIDPDSDLSNVEISVIPSDARLITYISYYGANRYLFLLPTEDISGEVTVWLEIVSGDSILTDRLRVRIEPVNDIPKIIMDDVEYQEDQGWMISGRVRDPDDSGGKIEYRIGDGDWRDAWGFKSWSILVDELSVPLSGQYIFIRAHDGSEYSQVEFTKLVWPYKPPVIDDGDEPADDDQKDDDDDPIPDNYLTPNEPGEANPPWLLIGGLGGLAIGAIFILLWSEVGFVTMVTAGISFYSKLSKKDILNHEIRGLIRGYIIANPGDHYSSIKRNLDLNNGTLAYHLRVLEQNGFVKSMFDGIYKRYYPANINISKLKKNVSKQEEIFNIILEHPGVTMDQIGRLIGVSRQVVNYHVKNLIRAGIVDYKRDDKSARFYPLEENLGMVQT